MRPRGRRWWAAPLAAALLCGAATARPMPAGPSTVLIGASWLGVWRGGRLVSSRAVAGWRFGAARLTPDGRTLEIAATRSTRAGADGERDVVLRFDARTLAQRGQGVDPALSRAEVRAPIGTDTGVPDDRAAAVRAGLPLPGRPGDRIVLSPDGNVMAVMSAPESPGADWQGTLMLGRAPHPIRATGLTIDDGSMRENGAARTIACLLPRGEGAIVTYLGAPADRQSEYQAFRAGARPVPLPGSYVMSCLSPRP